ncbi:MAG: hypothetical protein ACK5JO_06385 [Halodesulfovibrio sp.]
MLDFRQMYNLIRGDQARYEQQLVQHEINSSAFYKAIEAALPPVFTRKTASQAIGGLISPKTFSNLNALGQGPSVAGKLGSKVAYERDSFMKWLRQRLR